MLECGILFYVYENMAIIQYGGGCIQCALLMSMGGDGEPFGGSCGWEL